MKNKSFQKPKKNNPALEQERIKAIIKKNMDDSYASGLQYGVVIYSVILLMVLSDKTSLSEEEIQKVIDEIGRAADSINGDYMTIPDVIKMLQDEYGYKLEVDQLTKYYPELNGYLKSDSDNKEK